MCDEQITFLDGVEDRSGGVQLLYGKGNEALLFDFGVAHFTLLFPKKATVYDPVHATQGRELRQYILAKMAPPLYDIYDPEHLRGLERKFVQTLYGGQAIPQYERISLFISHLHQDHIALLPYLREGIAVYMNRDAYALYKGLVHVGHITDTKASLIPCDDLSTVDFGPFSLQFVEMDHNITGATGMILDSDNYKIAYTGDWRRCGRHPDRIDRFIDLCRKKGLDMLITEGTRAKESQEATNSQPYGRKEEENIAGYREILSNAEGLVYLQVGPMDLEKVADMISIAVESGRKIVMDASLAAVWHVANAHGIQALQGHPSLKADVLVLEETRKDSPDVPFASIALEQLADRKGDYIYFLKFHNLAHLVELETLGSRQGPSHYVHSEYSLGVDHPSLAKFLKVYGISGHSLNGWGHAHPLEISDMIERIGPRTVLPIHSNYPGNIQTGGIKSYIPKRGETKFIKDIL